MKFISFPLIMLVILISGSFRSAAEVRLPSIIGSHMVLQQKSEVNLWGWCAPSEKINVSVSWDTIKYVTQGTSGAKWELKIKTPAAGGPYSITINDKTVLEDVMTGEVWICGGQSNMEWGGNQKLKQSLDEAPNAGNLKIRFFYVPKSTSEFPQEDVRASEAGFQGRELEWGPVKNCTKTGRRKRTTRLSSPTHYPNDCQFRR